MGKVTEIDFRLIVPRCGGQREAFEELCCQLPAVQLQAMPNLSVFMVPEAMAV